ncbi:MAG: glycogen debranching protein [Actinomycetota bacterium]
MRYLQDATAVATMAIPTQRRRHPIVWLAIDAISHTVHTSAGSVRHTAQVDHFDPDRPPPLGVYTHGTGVTVAVYAGSAESVEFCILPSLDAGNSEHRVELPHQRHGVHFGFIPDVKHGTHYGFRTHGPWDPARGLHHNPAKLLLDPYARGIAGNISWRPEVYGHQVNDDLLGTLDIRDDRNSAPYVPQAVIVDNTFDWVDDQSPRIPWAETIIYEAHVRGLTRLHADLPAHLQGTYAGLAHPTVLRHLHGLGVTTVQLLPIHAFVSEPALVRRGLTNFWGYNTLGFFAPHSAYGQSLDPTEVLREFKTMVKDLHTAGLEVVLDVVYNHTCEQNRHGPTLSWRGLDSGYYRTDATGHEVDVTGCGNSMDFSNPRVIQFALDSLRYWVNECHVDGFRFDLATTLARGKTGEFEREHAFLTALRSDPVLSQVKLVMEPWDVGPNGWRTGQFPPPTAEWNDRYRDGVRTFWLADAHRNFRHYSSLVRSEKPGHPTTAHARDAVPAALPQDPPSRGVSDLATRLSGSEDLFGHPRQDNRGPIASINYIAAHDGFTLADCVSYEHRHNEANGEGNRDGHPANHTWNHNSLVGGDQDGPTADATVIEQRWQSIRNLLGTLLLSHGIPMITAGDELGRTQQGNNNAYCQDNRLTWLDWALSTHQRHLIATTAELIRLRRALPELRSSHYIGHHGPHPDGTTNLAWFTESGDLMTDHQWHDRHLRTMQVYWRARKSALPNTGEERHHLHDRRSGVLLVIQGDHRDVKVTLPGLPWADHYTLAWDSTWPTPQASMSGRSGAELTRGRTMRLYLAFKDSPRG